MRALEAMVLAFRKVKYLEATMPGSDASTMELPGGTICVPNPAPLEPTRFELAIRRMAITMVADHWDELKIRLAKWLGQAFREDDSLPGEVAYVMIRRYRGGHGHLVRHLRADPNDYAMEAKHILFREARWVIHEVLPEAVEYRMQCHRNTELRLDIAACSSPSEGDEPRWDGTTGVAGGIQVARIELFVRAIDVLLDAGERVWGSFCDDGLLDPDAWTVDQKWTAIGMMWGFSVDQIAMIRAVNAPRSGKVASRDATRQMMATVRRKGRVLVDAMTHEERRRYDVLGRGR